MQQKGWKLQQWLLRQPHLAHAAPLQSSSVTVLVLLLPLAGSGGLLLAVMQLHRR
jgi:hypothetical protein